MLIYAGNKNMKIFQFQPMKYGNDPLTQHRDKAYPAPHAAEHPNRRRKRRTIFVIFTFAACLDSFAATYICGLFEIEKLIAQKYENQIAGGPRCKIFNLSKNTPICFVSYWFSSAIQWAKKRRKNFIKNPPSSPWM